MSLQQHYIEEANRIDGLVESIKTAEQWKRNRIQYVEDDMKRHLIVNVVDDIVRSLQIKLQFAREAKAILDKQQES